MRSRLAILAPVAAALVALGCVSAPEAPSAGEPAKPPAATRTAVAGDDPDGTDTPEEFEADLGDAQRVAETYWEAEFKSSGIDFDPVAQAIPYEKDGEIDCGGQGLGLNNAAYCSAGDFIAYDVNFAVTAFARIGDAFLYYLLGHEYAHGIQVRLGIQYSYTIQQELQADCMAGAYIGDSVRSGALTIEEGDIDEFREGLLAVGDDPNVPWFAPGAHGTAEQRASSFFGGYERSLAACDLPRG
jgi:predicted metalloprotease